MPKPGFVRVINLSSDSVQLTEGTRPLFSSKPGQTSIPITIGKGSRTLTLKQNEESHPIPLDVVSGEGTTLIVRAGKKPVKLTGERPHPTETGNVRVVCLEPGGEVSSSEVNLTAKGSSTVPISANNATVSLLQGEWTIQGSGLPPLKVKVANQSAYTLLLLKKNRGLEGHWMLNTPDNKAIGLDVGPGSSMSGPS
jgi:hypothetical protein